MLLFEWASRIETVGYKLAAGKGLREGWGSKELWNSVEKAESRCQSLALSDLVHACVSLGSHERSDS